MGTPYFSPLTPPLPLPTSVSHWGRLYGSAYGLAIARAAEAHAGLVVIVTGDMPSATRLENELRFYLGADAALPILAFPDWETLPYDAFSPHQDIISQRLETLYHLPQTQRGILIVPVATLMHRIAPPEYLAGHVVLLNVGDHINMEQLRRRLDTAGYRCVSQVMEHGEFAVRGSLIDLFPMGSRTPYRIDLLDEEVESIRTFDPETQRSQDQVRAIRLLPAKEFPLTEAAITRFRQNYREVFEGDPQQSRIYRDVSAGITPPGIEYYLPLFFDKTATLFDYFPASSLVFTMHDTEHGGDDFDREVQDRLETTRYDRERPPLPSERLFLRPQDVQAHLGHFSRVALQPFEGLPGQASNFATQAPPGLHVSAHAKPATHPVVQFLAGFAGRVLFCAESVGRRETLLEMLHHHDIYPGSYGTWANFLGDDARLGITVAPLEQGLLLENPPLAVITEAQLFGEQVRQQRRRTRRTTDIDAIISNLAELRIGSPVVHQEHGVGRYLGLQKLTVGGLEHEFLTLEYAGGDKLYVPVSSLHLIGRYSGIDPEHAPLHKLGSGQWERARRKAAEQVRDTAAELLAIYAQRAARKGFAYSIDDEHYQRFAAAFPFEETPDQQEAIRNVLADMASDQPMDRLVCGDVGFGKTEVAMRAAFVAVQAGKQVAVLVPTTLLAQQHWQNFRDRFADWPVRIESLSRFRTKKEQDAVLVGLADGTVDIVIGTHKLLQDELKFKRLGLVIIDEEHRFGVRQKERFKALRSEVDLLTLTATPIPRTLNMALSDIRSLSIIATPPARRLSVKTFVGEWNDVTIHEACLREIKRGGQVFFLHNEVKTIEKIAARIASLVPEASLRVAHGQMRERELEQVMSDFYHQRFNTLVCTTIIETGIDIPSANTIIINEADHFGLAQLYQLRGRVGRSHHRAYAYLVIPPVRTLTPDAVKRLEALESIEELGAGFLLATHDLEIRGAGELLGEEQSGQIQEIGFTLYMELLEQAVNDLKAGRQIQLERPLEQGTEVDLGLPALIPSDYLPDVHTRLIMYKRIASARSTEELRELQVEMIDRFGLLPEAAKILFRVTELKLHASPLGIRKIELGAGGGRLTFVDQPNIDPMTVIRLIQTQPKIYQLDGKNRLKLIKSLPDTEQRFAAIEQLVKSLAAPVAA